MRDNNEAVNARFKRHSYGVCAVVVAASWLAFGLAGPWVSTPQSFLALIFMMCTVIGSVVAALVGVHCHEKGQRFDKLTVENARLKWTLNYSELLDEALLELYKARHDEGFVVSADDFRRWKLEYIAKHTIEVIMEQASIRTLPELHIVPFNRRAGVEAALTRLVPHPRPID